MLKVLEVYLLTALLLSTVRPGLLGVWSINGLVNRDFLILEQSPFRITMFMVVQVKDNNSTFSLFFFSWFVNRKGLFFISQYMDKLRCQP